MAKPATLDGHSDQYTLDCERVLVTLLRGLGPWKDSVCLVGGLTPRYLVKARPPVAGGRVQPLPTEGTISAINIPHSSIVFDLHEVTQIEAELLGGDGIAVEKIKHANMISFTCLKAFAFDQRFERRDAHDLIYCLEHACEGTDAVARAFRQALEGKHSDVVKNALDLLRARFAQVGETEGYRKDGPVAVAKFELGEGDEPEQREARALRQREASDVIERLLAQIDHQ